MGLLLPPISFFIRKDYVNLHNFPYLTKAYAREPNSLYIAKTPIKKFDLEVSTFELMKVT